MTELNHSSKSTDSQKTERSDIPRVDEFDNKYVQRYLKKRHLRKDESTFISDSIALRGYMGFLDCKLSEVTYKDSEDFVDLLVLQGYPRGTIERRLSSMRMFHKRMNQWFDMRMPDLRGLSANNYSNIPDGYDREALSRDEINKMMEATGDSSFPIRGALIVGLLYYTGLRRTELAELKFKDVDTDNRRVRVIDGKNDKNRIVPYHENLDWLMSTWIESTRHSFVPAAESDFFLVTHRTSQVSGNLVYRTVREAADESGVQEVIGTMVDGRNRYRVTPHVLRHSLATHLANDRVPLREIKAILGHEKLETTLIYSHDAEEAAWESYSNDFSGL